MGVPGEGEPFSRKVPSPPILSFLLRLSPLFQLYPCQFVLVAGEMQEARAGDGGEAGSCGVVCFCLKLEGTDKISAGAKFEPAGDDFKELVGIADHV